MHRGEVDGVPTFWMEGPEPLSAVLMFAVGIRDEPFVRRGVTHLVEHLAMSRLGRRHHDHNASVGPAITTFEAAGPAEAVSAFLSDVCAALHDLPVERLETEKRIVAVETHHGPGPGAFDLMLRHGVRGPGLAAVDPPAQHALEAATIQDWAARHFLRSTAVLALSGPPPAGLRLPLPDGPAPARSAPPALELGGPVWLDHGDDLGVTLSVGIPKSEAAGAAARIAEQRLTDRLRHELGLVYDVDIDLASDSAAPGPGGAILTVLADAPARSAVQVVRVLDDVLAGLRDTGPTDAELAEDLAGYAAAWADPRTVLAHAAQAAAEHLHGTTWDPATALAEREAVTPAAVRDALAGYPATAILVVPDGVDPGLPGFSPYPEHRCSPVTGRSFARRRFTPVPRGASLIVGTDGVTLHQRDGSPTVRFDDAIGYAVHDDGLRTLYGGDGCLIDLHPDFFRSGADALELIEARIPADIRFVPAPAEGGDHPGRG